MSFSKIFGGKKKEPVPSTGDAIQKLRQTEEMLIKKQTFLEKKISEEIKIAKQKGTRDKRGAINALKRKKRLEKQLQNVDGTLSTIELQREALENANTNAEVLKNMSFAAKALKTAHQSLDVEDVHDMMDDINDQMETANEIGEAISSSFAYETGLDEDDLLAELEELEQEELDEKLLDVGPSVSDKLPEVPSEEPSRPHKAKEAEDDDMAELAAWAS